MEPAIKDVAITLPYFAGREEWVNDQDQNVSKIIKAIAQNHKLDHRDYDSVSEKFWRGNVRDTGKCLFDFCKKYIKYIVESENDQTVKTPGRIVADRYGDCKHYALFINGVCDSLARKGYPVECSYRFVSDYPDKEVHHVFAVIRETAGIGYRNEKAATYYREKMLEYAKKNGIRLIHGYEATGRINGTSGREYWVDPVISYFDERPKFYNTKDVVMAISRLSGTYEQDIPNVAGHHSRERRAAEMFVNPFAGPHEIINFLRRHGKHPHDFKNKHDLAKFIVQHHDQGRAHLRNAGASSADHQVTITMPGQNTATAQRSAAGVGKKKQAGHKNFLAKLASGYKTNANNLAKGEIKHLKDVKKLTLKVSLSAARGSFLSLVDINAFNLAHRLRNTLVGHERGGLLKKWEHLGGNPKMLINAVNSGYRQYKIHHGGYVIARDKIHGTSCVVAGVGVVQVAAVLALATAIIGALGKYIHSTDAEKKQMAGAAKEGVDKIAAGAIKQGEAMAEDSTGKDLDPMSPHVKATTGINENGDPEIKINDVSHPLIKNAGLMVKSSGGSGSADEQDDIPGGGPVQPHENPEAPANSKHGFDLGGQIDNVFGGITGMIAKYKKPLFIAGGAILAITVGPRIFTALKGKKKKGR